jgi:signal transduction histidine kinase
LDFSRIKKPTLQFEDINAIVKETLRRINVKTDVEMSLELDNNLPDIEVDALQIQQVFYNLANNALQSMDKGGRLKIKTSVQREAHSIERKEDEVQAASDERRETEFIEISFQDSGCGILKENLSKIFEPLFSTKAKGTGLGLSVCSSIIEGHGGKIEVESEAGRGSTFRVLLLTRQG